MEDSKSNMFEGIVGIVLLAGAVAVTMFSIRLLSDFGLIVKENRESGTTVTSYINSAVSSEIVNGDVLAEYILSLDTLDEEAIIPLPIYIGNICLNDRYGTLGTYIEEVQKGNTKVLYELVNVKRSYEISYVMDGGGNVKEVHCVKVN